MLRREEKAPGHSGILWHATLLASYLRMSTVHCCCTRNELINNCAALLASAILETKNEMKSRKLYLSE